MYLEIGSHSVEVRSLKLRSSIYNIIADYSDDDIHHRGVLLDFGNGVFELEDGTVCKVTCDVFTTTLIQGEGIVYMISECMIHYNKDKDEITMSFIDTSDELNVLSYKLSELNKLNITIGSLKEDK